jgi:hypothetical protein
MHLAIALDDLPELTAEQRLIGNIMSADWSAGAVRTWPQAWFRNIDWAKIPGLSWQYKVRSMTAAAIREAGWPYVPADVRRALEEAERFCVSKSLRQVSFLKDIIAAAKAENLRIIVMKGIALSAHLYADPVIREAFDLDLLVHPDDRKRMDDVLLALGCTPTSNFAPLTPRQEAILKRFHYDRKFFHEASGTVLERHDALDRNPHLIATDFDDLWDRRAQARIGDYSAEILGDIDLAHYLGIHAARHAWERWKWIADLCVLYRRATEERLLQIRDEAEKSGFLTPFNSWILLVVATTGTTLPPAVTQGALHDRGARRLAARILRSTSIAQTIYTIRSHHYALPTYLSRVLLKHNFRYVAFEIVTLFHRDEDWYAWRFPDPLIPLYYLLRPFSYIYRRLWSFVRP